METNKLNILIIGCSGFIGETIYNCFKHKFKSVTGITKHADINEFDSIVYDVVINANGNSKKYLANNNPFEDFKLSTSSVYESLFNFKYRKYIYISSIEAETSSVYGFNKSLSESIVRKYCNDYIIIRPSTVIGKEMKKGLVKDIIENQKVYLTENSSLQLITVNEIVNVIHHIILCCDLLKNLTINAYGKESMTVKEIGELLNKNIIYNHNLTYESYNLKNNNIDFEYDFKTTKHYLTEFINERMERPI